MGVSVLWLQRMAHNESTTFKVNISQYTHIISVANFGFCILLDLWALSGETGCPSSSLKGRYEHLGADSGSCCRCRNFRRRLIQILVCSRTEDSFSNWGRRFTYFSWMASLTQQKSLLNFHSKFCFPLSTPSYALIKQGKENPFLSLSHRELSLLWAEIQTAELQIMSRNPSRRWNITEMYKKDRPLLLLQGAREPLKKTLRFTNIQVVDKTPADIKFLFYFWASAPSSTISGL